MSKEVTAGVPKTQYQEDDSMFGVYADLIKNRKDYYKNIIRPGYFSWLIGQMSQWSKFSWGLVITNSLLQTYIVITSLMAADTTTKVVAAIAGFLGAVLSVMCVIGIANRSSIQGYFGITSAIAIATSAILSHLYANAIEQLLIYIPFLDIPSILHPSWAEKIVPRKFESIAQWIKYIVFALISWGVLAFIFSLTDDKLFITDSLTLAISLSASLIMLNRYSNQYYFWLAGNAVSIVLYFQALMQGTATPALAVSYTFFVINSTYGLFAWTKSVNAMKKQAQA